MCVVCEKSSGGGGCEGGRRMIAVSGRVRDRYIKHVFQITRVGFDGVSDFVCDGGWGLFSFSIL